MPATPNGATISRVTELQVLDNLGRPQSQVRVEFMVGNHGPFYETFPKVDFTAQHVIARLDQFAQHINQLSR